MDISERRAIEVLKKDIEISDEPELTEALNMAINCIRDSKDKTFLIWQVEHIIEQLDQPHNTDLIRLLKEILGMIKKTNFDERWTDVRDGLPTNLDEDYIVTAVHTYGDMSTQFEDIEVFETSLLREEDPNTGQRFEVPYSKCGSYEVIAWQHKPGAYERRTL